MSGASCVDAEHVGGQCGEQAVSDVNYDIVIVGGGLGGSALAKAMAERGASVLVLEREKQFRDRVRGEGVWPWGGAAHH